MLVSFCALSQSERLIRGVVKSKQDGLPLPGASVFLFGTRAGATTNFNGEFTYLVKSRDIENTFIEVRFLGFQTQKIRLGSKSYFEIFLEEEEDQLQEVVLTSSYGTKKLRESVVGSISTVRSEDLQVQQATESFDKMLEGLAAGVLVTGSSTLGTPVRIDIRGQGTLTPLNNAQIGTSPQPLFIIDGVVMTEEGGVDDLIFDGRGSLAEQFKNPLARIAPEDIESITILKDAAAVAIYGADAANGVIIVTTKRSTSRKPTFSFSSQLGFAQFFNQIQYLSGPQYHEIYKEYLMSQGQSPQQAFINAGSNEINTNWFDLLNGGGSFQRYSFTAGVRKKNWSFRGSLTAQIHDEPPVSNNFKRYGGQIGIGYQNDRIQLQWNITPSLVHRNAPNTLFNFPLPPNISPFDEEGDFSLLGFNGFGNPLAVARQNLNFSETFGVLQSINFSYKINNHFRINTVTGIDYSEKNQKRYFSGFNESGRFNGTFQEQNPDGSTTVFPIWGRRLDFFRNSFRWNQSAQLLYEKTFNSHDFSGIFGAEAQRERIENRRLLGTGFVNPGPVNDARDAGARFQQNQFLSENARRSFFLQVNYQYDKRYSFLGTIRRDESSAFGSDVNVAYNGAAGLGWNIHHEDFFNSIKWVDFFRFRTSYGVTGNSRIGSFRALGLYTLDVEGFDGYNGGEFAFPSSSPNPFLSWERNYKFNVGFDFNFFRKFQLTVEYFNDHIRDMITTRNIPLETGFSNIQINGADMFNRGIEFTFNAQWVNTDDFKWRMQFNISSLENRITALRGLGTQFSTSELARAQRVGTPTSAIWGVRFAGVDPATGRELYYNNGEVYDAATYRQLFTPDDWEIIGDSQPDFFGGWNHNFTFFKRFQLTVRTSFRWGDQILINDELESQYRVLVNRNLSVNVMDRWQQPGDQTIHPRITAQNPIIQNSSKFVYDASHIRIQNINLSYQFKLSEKTLKYLQSFQVFGDISNVAYFYRERSLRGKNGVAQYRFLYPEARTFTLGIQAQL